MTEETRAAHGLSRARRASAAAALLAIGLATVPIAMSKSEPKAVVSPERIDLNAAGVHELQLLPSVGPAIAARILAEREKHGPFASVDDLARVPGVGERTVRRLRDYSTVRP